MADEIVIFPKRRRHKRTVSVPEMYAVPEPSDEMVWNLCPYLLNGDDRCCRSCPSLERDEMAVAYSEDGEGLRFGESRQVCERCLDGKEPFTPKPDAAEWVTHKLTDPTWQEWRDENPDAVAAGRRALAESQDQGGRDV